MSWLAEHDAAGSLTAVAIAPDLGERYLDTIYQTNWVHELYGEEVLDPPELLPAAISSSAAAPDRLPAPA